MRKLVIGLILVLMLGMVACSPKSTDSKAEKVAQQILADAKAEQAQKDTISPQEPSKAVPEPKEVPEEKVTEELTAPESPKVTKTDSVEIPQVEKIQSRITEEELEAPNVGRTIMNEYFDTYINDVTGYKFREKQGQFFVRGNVYKIILEQQQSRRHITSIQGNYHPLYYFDTVYVNRDTNQTVGYCEGHTEETNAQCESLGIYDEAVLLKEGSYAKLLPHDFLVQFLNSVPENVEKNLYSIKRRGVTKLKVDGNILYFDKRMGLPIRVDLLDNGNLKRFDFEDLSHNTVRSVDVIHRNRNDIPSEDIFYSNR